MTGNQISEKIEFQLALETSSCTILLDLASLSLLF